MNRQAPQPGGKRARRMATVKAWLTSNPEGATYVHIAKKLRLSLPAVQGAVLDLHLFDPDLVVSIPAPKNGYTVRAGWNATSKRGEANQARHNATRQAREAIRLAKAAEQEGDSSYATVLRMAAREADMQAKNLADLAGSFKE